jgi:hypothetical protein
MPARSNGPTSRTWMPVSTTTTRLFFSRSSSDCRLTRPVASITSAPSRSSTTMRASRWIVCIAVIAFSAAPKNSGPSTS